MQGHLTYIIVDDDNKAIDDVLAFTHNYSFLQYKSQAANAIEALEKIKIIRPDILFSDIDMPGVNGIEMVRAIREYVSAPIFITSHSEYAWQGFEVEAFDFILKPIEGERFQTCMNRIQDFFKMKERAATGLEVEKNVITIKDGGERHNILLHDIHYLEAMREYTKVVTANESFLTLGTLNKLLEQINNDNLLRIHRSYAIPIDKIDSFNRNEVIMHNITLPIGKTYRKAIWQQLS